MSSDENLMTTTTTTKVALVGENGNPVPGLYVGLVNHST